MRREALDAAMKESTILHCAVSYCIVSYRIVSCRIVSYRVVYCMRSMKCKAAYCWAKARVSRRVVSHREVWILRLLYEKYEV